ncbi:flagellar biosynthesis anti-sigma factor FlgM [Novosphingobium sp. FGD1]|uniref:Negative regulator of flagellin synthesis n=1 Tax=Novosphingobium silvae TaxID=2692619 RepID=A0A7X4K7P9_9SPHN|nr:flagellar biosynthesis anti-sigma factor FlgM [Novosphingobium silvae]MYL97538.1 flagellar biosynthesis anti-sigma factor FlgM [Novosphingobium silvae]
MPPIEVGSAPRIGAIDTRLPRVADTNTVSATAKAQATNPVSAAPAVETINALDPGAAPIDTDRVALIRKAVESGTYPVVPAKIADAMIAAGMLLRSAH